MAVVGAGCGPCKAAWRGLDVYGCTCIWVHVYVAVDLVKLLGEVWEYREEHERVCRRERPLALHANTLLEKYLGDVTRSHVSWDLAWEIKGDE